MVDFKKLRDAKAQPPPINPVDIFRRLPKPPRINDLYTSQAEVLQEWFARRQDRDIVIKLHTGGGKTLVGMLIATSALNERHEPVVYLCPTRQLVDQTIRLAADYGLPAFAYGKGVAFSEEFLAGERVLVCTYQAVFNGKSRFGVKGIREPLNVGTIIADDAHVAFSSVRDAFTLRIERGTREELYVQLTALFRNDFEAIGKIGTFDDIVGGKDSGVVEVPHWNWKARCGAVRETLQPLSEDENLVFSWPLLRDQFPHSHALISKGAFVITPYLPPVDLLPAFAECPRRIFMSATIGDDSAIVTTFDADPALVGKPILSRSLAGVSERMILLPHTMPLDGGAPAEIGKAIVERVRERHDVAVVALVPSRQAARAWETLGPCGETSEAVAEQVRMLQDGASKGPFVFANRYDGIDLPGDACRVLVLAGMPQGATEYDQYLATVTRGGAARNSALAQRIEQGMGRAARGAGDYCVVIAVGKDLSAWLGRAANLGLLTSSTRAQLEMGLEVSRDIKDLDDLVETIDKCLARNREWVEYHAESLARLTEPAQIDLAQLEGAGLERSAFALIRSGYYEKATMRLTKYVDDNRSDKVRQGWLLELAARAASLWGNEELAQELQRRAYSKNGNVARPKTLPHYVRISAPGRQAHEIAGQVDEFRPRRAFLDEFDEVASRLVPGASSNQFEQALADFGGMLGFRTERPEKTLQVGPDVLWQLSDDLFFVIEAKNQKGTDNPLTKGEQGQLMVSLQWFRDKYPMKLGIPVVVQPSDAATRGTAPGECRVLTLARVRELAADARTLLADVCDVLGDQSRLREVCAQLLEKSKLTPETLPKAYLAAMRVV